MEAGSNGLGVFYILSGFLAFFSLDKYKGNIKSWIAGRLWRILPMYYFAVIVYMIFYEFIVKSVPEDPNKIKWLAYFLGINTILKKNPGIWYNVGALSSMSVFMWFYILAPFIRKVVTTWKRALAFFAVCYIALRLLQYTEWLTMFRAYYYFALGILIFYAIKEKREKITGSLFAAGIMFLLLADARGGLVYALAVGILMLLAYNMSVPGEGRVISFLSNRTFAIYIGHAMAIEIVSKLMDEINAGSTILMIVIAIVAITVLYEVFDKGARKLSAKLRH